MVENNIQTTRRRLLEKFIKNLLRRISALEKLVAARVSGELESTDTLCRAVQHLKGIADAHRQTKIAGLADELECAVANLSANNVAGETDVLAVHQALTKLKAQAESLGLGLRPLYSYGCGNKQRIVIVDDDKAEVEQLCSLLGRANFRTEVFSGFAAFRLACGDQGQPAAVIMDIGCLEGDDANKDAIAEMKAQCLKGLPVIFLSARQDVAAKLAAYRAGATRFLTKPVGQDALLRAIADSVALIPAEPYRVLMVDDDSRQLAAHSLILQQAGMMVQAVNDPLQAFAVLADFAADILVTAMAMSECSGTELAAILREHEPYRQLPVIYLSLDTILPKQLLALDRGADHFLTKPLEPQHLVAAVSLHARHFRQTRNHAEDLRVMLYEWERQHQALDSHAIVSLVDASGNIIYVNDKFCEISGYSRKKLLGRNHRILKSEEHPESFFADMWRTIVRGAIWQGDVCNRRKDGSEYWVKSTIVPFLDADGLPYQYISIRTDVTQIKAAGKRLNILNRAVEASSGSISIADANDPKLPLIYVNPAFEQITGYSRAEAVGHNARFLLGDDRNQPELANVRVALREGKTGEALLRNYRKDGSLFWNKMRLAPVHDEQGSLTHFIGVIEDVTQQKKADEDRQEAFDRLQKITGRVPGVVYQLRLEPNGRYSIPFASAAIRKLFRVNPEDLRNDPSKVLEAVHQDDYHALMLSIEASAHNMTPWGCEFRLQFDDGTVRWLFGNSEPEREADGSILWYGFITDITDRKHSERALKESSQHTQVILDNVVDGIITIDGQGIVSSFNKAAQQIFGYAANEIVGKNVSLLMPGPNRNPHDTYFENYHNTKKKHIIGIGQEMQGQRKDGRVFPIDLAVSEIEIEGKPLFMWLIRDISTRKQHEAMLLAAKDEAERASLAKSKFLSSMSHELRTPMNAVLGFAQLMEIDESLPKEHKENVHEILKAGQHLMELINEVLNLAKIESGSIELSIETVIVSNVLDECVKLIRPMADLRGIQISYAGFANILLRADYLRLKQALLNLLSNAIKYNRPNGKVQIDYEHGNNNRVRIKVSDTGTGIPENLLGELFQPFNRLGTEGLNIHGTGIGLTITRQLIELMGGEIGVESTFGIGSTFWLELPREAKAIKAEVGNAFLPTIYG